MRGPARFALWFAGIAAVAAVVVASGFEQAPAPLPMAAIGESVVADPVVLTPLFAELRSVFPGTNSSPEDGSIFLVVTATVENTWNKPLRVFDALLSPEGVDGRLDRLMYAQPGMTWATLQPGVAATVSFLWQVPEGQFAAGDVVRVDINGQSLIEGGLLDSEPRWALPEPIAQVELPLTLGSVRGFG